MQPFIRHITGVIALLIGLAGDTPAADVDPDLLRLLMSSQETNSQRYSSGRMSLTYEDRDEDLSRRTVVGGEFTWDGNRVFSHFDRTVYVLGTDTVKEREVDVRVQTPAVRYRFEPRHELMTKMRPEDRKFLSDDYRLLPHERWFRPGTAGRRAFLEMLDPAFAKENVTRYRVSRGEGHRAEAVREYKIGGVMRCVYDLSQEGNLVQYDTQPGNIPQDVPAFSLAEAGTFTWVPDGDGHFRLGEMVIEDKDGSTVRRRQHLVITKFDPHPQLEASQFTEVALDMPLGTSMEDQTKTKHVRYRYGGAAPKPLGDEALDKLAEAIQTRGFAQPDRGGK